MTDVRLSWGAATDVGLVRTRNEDRHWIDEDAGAFLVVDGVGGHAAGERAAEIAVAAIRESLGASAGAAVTERVRAAIAAANSRIYEEARSNPVETGMACVLTLALVEGARVTIGHVGDSRLYLLNGSGIRRLTSDHSPVGEMEDSGEISEEEAMSHPRRNEVYRDVGTCPPGEWLADFAEVLQYEFPPTAALLLCSDGLSGHLTSREICEVAGRCGGDAEESARRLVRAANAAGGTDNITVVFVAGPEFRPAQPATRPRHRTTRLRLRRGFWTGRAAFLSYGLLLGMVLWAVLRIRG